MRILRHLFTTSIPSHHGSGFGTNSDRHHRAALRLVQTVADTTADPTSRQQASAHTERGTATIVGSRHCGNAVSPTPGKVHCRRILPVAARFVEGLFSAPTCRSVLAVGTVQNCRAAVIPGCGHLLKLIEFYLASPGSEGNSTIWGRSEQERVS